MPGAETTGVHRHARGVADDTVRSRASVVINDSQLSASQPLDQLGASSANALGYATTAVTITRSTPIVRERGDRASDGRVFDDRARPWAACARRSVGRLGGRPQPPRTAPCAQPDIRRRPLRHPVGLPSPLSSRICMRHRPRSWLSA